MQRQNLKIATLVPTYKRPEYTEKCLAVLSKEPTNVITICKDSLRDVILDFFEQTKQYDYIFKIDNDCVVPSGYINSMIKIFEESDVDILSPNVYPSNAAIRYGKYVHGCRYWPAETVGGLWSMRPLLIKDLEFERYDVKGITGAISVLRQIQNETECKVGWTVDVVVQDMGHWSGEHPLHIKSEDHYNYSQEIGRDIAWKI